MHKLTSFWADALRHIDYAFQPIVNPYTGVMYAVEALIRNVEQAGFTGIDDFFDTAYREGELYTVDVHLRDIVFEKFIRIPNHDRITLFYNYDHRVLSMANYSPNTTEQLLARYGLDYCNICFELSEKHKVTSISHMHDAHAMARSRGFRIALDDFGSGYAGIEILYHTEPDYLKLDRFLIKDIDRDPKKRSCAAHIVSLAHLLGVTVIAEGIETADELRVCRDIRCDLVQGYFIQRPTVHLSELPLNGYADKMNEVSERRRAIEDVNIVTREMRELPAVSIDADMSDVLTMFQEHPEFAFLPVVDRAGSPLGLVHERHFKRYVYSPYGKELLVNRSLTRSLYPFMTKCPVADISEPVEKLLEVFVNAPGAEGIILMRSLRYVGFLSASSLLSTLHDKNIALARDLNPLTRLPGNHTITRFITEASDSPHGHRFIYFDFDNFKPFNDRFGFRQGDRALLLFADILRRHFTDRNDLVGHVGGDDFFIGQRLTARGDDWKKTLESALREFRETTRSFYTEDEIVRGTYRARGRDGVERSFPLLTVSAAVIETGDETPGELNESLPEMLAAAKHSAKRSDTGIALIRLGDGDSIAAQQ